MDIYIKRIGDEKYEEINLGNSDLSYKLGDISTVSIIFDELTEDEINEIVDKIRVYNTNSIDFYFSIESRIIGSFVFNNVYIHYTKEENTLQFLTEEAVL